MKATCSSSRLADYDFAATPRLAEHGEKLTRMNGAVRLTEKLRSFWAGSIVIGVCKCR